MSQNNSIIQDFTGVYAEQPFMQGLRGRDDARYIDCSDIPGTDCYCDDEAVEAIRRRIADAGITDAHGIHFFDNGNYHYMSKIWTDMVQEPFSLVVFDHHPDMQEPRFGNILSCGGWVKTTWWRKSRPRLLRTLRVLAMTTIKTRYPSSEKARFPLTHLTFHISHLLTHSTSVSTRTPSRQTTPQPTGTKVRSALNT